MKAIERLEREHVWVRHISTCLETLVAEAKARNQLPEATYEVLSKL